MVDSKPVKKKRNVAQEVEMVQTSDNFKANTGGDQNGDGFAQPKGVQTRKAIAQHLA